MKVRVTKVLKEVKPFLQLTEKHEPYKSEKAVNNA